MSFHQPDSKYAYKWIYESEKQLRVKNGEAINAVALNIYYFAQELPIFLNIYFFLIFVFYTRYVNFIQM